jgi:DNA-binding NarL/FixJ family response regulator
MPDITLCGWDNLNMMQRMTDSGFKMLLFSEEPQLAFGAAALLQSSGEFEVEIASHEVSQLVPVVLRTQPDLLLVDLSPEMTLSLFAVLRKAAPETHLVLWARKFPAEFTVHARELGVAGFLQRTSSNEAFVSSLVGIAKGGTSFEAEPPQRSTRVHLTRRESQLVMLLAQGLKNKEIASCLSISEGTVRIYLSRLFQKVGARDRLELAVFGLKNAYCGQASWDGHNAFVTEAEEDRARPFLRSLVLVEPARRSGYPEASMGVIRHEA